MKKQYYLIDIFKYVFAIGIVALHTPVLSIFGEYEYYIEKLIVRLGVPFFFVVSGFLFGQKLNEIKDNDIDGIRRIFIAYTKRLLKPLIFFETIAIILNLPMYLEDNFIIAFLKIIRSIIFYPGGKLWYIQASIVGVWLIYLIKKVGWDRYTILIGGILYLFALVNNSYYFMIENNLIGKIVKINMMITNSARNGIFVGLFFISLGIVSSKIHNKYNEIIKARFILAGISITLFILYVFEIFILRDKNFCDDKSLFVVLPLFVFSFVLWLATFVNTRSKTVIFRNLSTGIYLLHDPMLKVMAYALMILSIKLSLVEIFILTLIIVHIICIVCYKRQNKFADILK